MSHPAGVRGLKSVQKVNRVYASKVAPRRGAWIEICFPSSRSGLVAGRTPQGCVD